MAATISVVIFIALAALMLATVFAGSDEGDRDAL